MNNQTEKFHVTELRFKAIKILLESGSTAMDVARYMGCGTTTVKRISACDTFADYKALMAAVSIENKARKERQKAAALAVLAAQEKPAAPVKPAVPATPPVPVQQEPPKQVVEYKQSVTIQATHYMENELKKQTELLTIISKKLAAIIDDLYGVKEAK